MRSLISTKELTNLLTSIVKHGGAVEAGTFLAGCHDGFQTFAPLMPYERFFTKWLSYRDFELTVPRFVDDGDSVTQADLQFKRPSRFPAPFVNRNRALIRKLRKIFNDHFGERPIVIEDNSGHQIHYRAQRKAYSVGLAESPGGECVIYNEPHSSGSTPEDETSIRNDFVVIRFHRAATNTPADLARCER
jgi:hypothetical protein